MASLRELLDNDNWKEVLYINGYALLMGYLTMAIRGLGFLVLTWTTVVLLGGFVSMLHNKDFWCLTFITLVQTAGYITFLVPIFDSKMYHRIFDVVLNEKLRYVMDVVVALLVGIFSGVMGDPESTLLFSACLLLACVLMLVQLVVLVTVLCPLAIIYLCGILMSGGISLWRLIEHDYGGNSNSEPYGEKSNLPPAMYTLYYLALLQGVLLCYRFSLGFIGKRLAKQVAGDKSDHSERKSIYKYLHQIRTGCEKDPSFAKERNLTTHAIDMISSNSPLDCISGVKMLYVAIKIKERKLKKLVMDGRKGSDKYRRKRDFLSGQRMLMKHLFLSTTSSKKIFQKLLETLNSRGLHERVTRKYAAMIVERLAFSINLDQFPQGIEHISSLIGTFEEYSIAEPYQIDLLSDVDEHHCDLRARCLPSPHGCDDSKLRKAYKKLLLHGLVIIQKLATHKNNCRVISNTLDLVSKIMAPITSDLLHLTTDHGAWSDVVQASMRVMMQLTTAPGETATKICHEISSCKQIISSMERIINCYKCDEEMQRSAILIMTQLYMHTESNKLTDFVGLKKESRENFVRMLVDIFTHDNRSIYIRECVGGALSELSFHGDTSDIVVIQTSGDVVHSLTEVLVHEKNKICRQKAAEILEHLCTHYTKDDKYLGKLNKAMTTAIPKVLGEILRCREETYNENKDDQDQDGFGKPKTDIKNQCDHTQGNNEHDEEEKAFQAVVQSVNSSTLLSSLVSLCGTVYDMIFICDLPPRFDASRFLTMLKEMVVERGERTVENLSVFKAVAKMVISMMKHSSRSVNREDLQSLIEALSSASINMLDLDYSMVFSSTDSSSGITCLKFDKRTLASLVKEAQELHASLPFISLSG